MILQKPFRSRIGPEGWNKDARLFHLDAFLTEFLEEFRQFVGCLAGAGACGFVTLLDECGCIGLEHFDLFKDRIYFFFHD